MAEPENQTLRILREIREEMRGGFEAVDKRLHQISSRMDNLREAVNGESVLGRYAAAEVEERLTEIEKRLSSLEKAG